MVEKRSWVSALVLVFINLVLLVGGILLLYISIKVDNTAWLDIIKTYWDPTNDIVVAFIVVGAVICGLALLGAISAVCRWRLGLLVYSSLLILVLIAAILIAVFGFIVYAKANDWDNSQYPAEDNEESIKKNFDEFYCYAQGEYICNSMPVTEMFQLIGLQISGLLDVINIPDDVQGVNDLCNRYGSLASVVDSVCDGCKKALEFKDLSDILEWANDECPRTNETIRWCAGEVLFDQDFVKKYLDITIGEDPYQYCRSDFLGLIESGSLMLAIGAVIVVVASIIMIVTSLYLRRKEKRARQHSHSDFAEVGDDPASPNAGRYMYNKD